MIGFGELPEYVLGAFRGRPASAWTDGPPGKWTPGQIVAHLATAMDTTATGYAARADHPPMRRRPAPLHLRLARRVIFATALFPPGRRAPERTRPPEHPDRAETEAGFRDAVARLLDLERRLLPARASDLFLRHPVFGDLTLGEFLRFHVVHAVHHRRQMMRRMGAGPGG